MTANTTETESSTIYKKDPRTTGGLKGLLYETKLISLMLFRLRRCEDIEQFYLATNYHKIGKFDDICLKVKVRGLKLPIFVFIQAKHREKYDDNGKEAGRRLDYNLFEKYRESIENIKNNLSSNEKSNDFFSGTFSIASSTFILYTNTSSVNLSLPPEAKHEEPDRSFAGDIVNSLIVTGAKTPKCYSNSGEKVVVYENQSDHNGIEKILKDEIEEYERGRNDVVQFNKEVIFLHYHYKVQDWWMKKTKDYLAECLTSAHDLYEDSLKDLSTEPHMSKMHILSMGDIHFDQFVFTPDTMEAFDKSIHSLCSLRQERSTVVLVTDFPTLKSMKVIRSVCLKNHYINMYSVVSLERLFKLSDKDLNVLIEELKLTKKVLIVICNTKQSNVDKKVTRFKELVDVIRPKNTIIITDNKLEKTVNEYLSHNDVVINNKEDKIRDSLMDLVLESREGFMNNGELLFQGREVNLKSVVDDRSVQYIKEGVFNKILRREHVVVGKSLVNPQYENIKYLHIDRTISHPKNTEYVSNNYRETYFDSDYRTVKKFSDVEEDVVLVTSAPGMGKSTLLTHLTHETNQDDVQYWIVRVNLYEYFNKFDNDPENNPIMDTLTTLNLMCQVTLENYKSGIRLEESDGQMNLIDCTDDDEATFELSTFLNFYNDKKIIFLFDGFDEICSIYKQQVMDIITIVKNNFRKCKMWVTSRGYSHILPDLEKMLGQSYVIEGFNCEEQKEYLHKFWSKKISLDSFTDDALNSIINSLKSKFVLNEDHNSAVILRPFFDTKCDGTMRDCDEEDEKTTIFYDDEDEEPIYVWRYLIEYLELKLSKNLPTTHQLSGNSIKRRKIYKFSGTPLILYLMADHHANLVINFDPNKLKTSFNIYETFVKNNIRKKSRDRNQYEKAVKKCFDVYKKIAAYTIYHTIFKNLSDLNEFENTPFSKEGILEIKNSAKACIGDEDEGDIISHVTSDNVPVFIHISFVEYFAAEFMIDILKSNISTSCKRLLYSAIYIETYSFGLRFEIDDRKKKDTELSRILIEEVLTNKTVCNFSSCESFFVAHDWTTEEIIRLYSSIGDDYDYDIYTLKHMRTCDTMDFDHDGSRCRFVAEFIDKMKPHLKQYFSIARSKSHEVVIREPYLESGSEEEYSSDQYCGFLIK